MVDSQNIYRPSAHIRHKLMADQTIVKFDSISKFCLPTFEVNKIFKTLRTQPGKFFSYRWLASKMHGF